MSYKFQRYITIYSWVTKMSNKILQPLDVIAIEIICFMFYKLWLAAQPNTEGVQSSGKDVLVPYSVKRL